MKRSPVLILLMILAIFSACKKDDPQPETVTDVDGNVYNTIRIGKQIWMTENLKVKRYNNGDTIPNLTAKNDWLNAISGAYCAYGNSDSLKKIYGNLYNWFAVNDPRKLAPAGWHIPTYDDWFVLQTFLGDLTVAGGKMKKEGTTYWMSPNTGAYNGSGFTGFPGGRRDAGIIDFSDLSYRGFWWSSTETTTSALYAYHWTLYYDSPNIGWSALSKTTGMSVRCVKD